MEASHKGHTHIVKLLLQAGADKNAKCNVVSCVKHILLKRNSLTYHLLIFWRHDCPLRVPVESSYFAILFHGALEWENSAHFGITRRPPRNCKPLLGCRSRYGSKNEGGLCSFALFAPLSPQITFNIQHNATTLSLRFLFDIMLSCDSFRFYNDSIWVIQPSSKPQLEVILRLCGTSYVKGLTWKLRTMWVIRWKSNPLSNFRIYHLNSKWKYEGSCMKVF